MRPAVILACAALLAASTPTQAEAQPQSAAQAAARTKGEEGLSLFKDSRWEEAHAAFAEADRLFHAPTLVLYMARCRRSQGRLLESKALFDKVLAEPVPPNAPPAFKNAVAAAHSEGDAVRARTPVLRLTLTGPGAERARVRVDGAVLGADELAAGKALDPGAHAVEAEADRARGASQVTLNEGETLRVELALREQAVAAPVATTRGSLVPAAVALSVGGAALVAGAVTGALALGKIGDAHAGCTQSSDGVWHCPPASRTEINAAASGARTLAPASAAFFAIGGVATVVGVALAVVRPGGKAPDRTGIAIDGGPGWIGVRGRF